MTKNIMLRKRFLTVLLFALCLARGFAGEAASNLVIHLTDGSSITCLLADEPTVKFSLSDLIVNSKKSSFSVPLDNLARFGFEKQSSPVAEVSSGKASYYVGDGHILVKGLSRGDCVRLYKTDGVCVFDKACTSDSGTTEIAIGALSPGVYLLNFNNTTAKIAIR